MTDKLTQIRAELPAVQPAAFLNTGTCGPLPTVAAEAVARVTESEYTQGRASTERFGKMMEDKASVKAQLGTLFNGPADSFAITHHTTDGMNIVTMGFNWQPGDEVATTTIEHEAGIYPLYLLQERYGVKINFADVGLGADPLEAIDQALTPKTRLLSLSHVSYSSGARFPLKDVIDLAHAKNIPVVVDGAQSAGVFPLDFSALNIDFYAIPGQKWLCGPESIGALYVRPDWLDRLHPTYPNYHTVTSHDWQGTFTLNETAVRFETGTVYPAVTAGFRATLDWFMDTVDPAWAYQRIADLSAYTRQAAEKLDGVRLVTPENRQASLVNFLPVGWSAAQMAGLVSELTARGYVIRSIPHEPFCLRVSCGFYNTEAEIDGMVEQIADILADGPESVAIPEWATMFGLSTEPVL
jgi:L-cysteine/cystine lyase